ncbi:hypothetical protein Cgig2_028040 [Carnegiea gigantea]|uniref:Uncharacterized protein n=1 Tax=Carnegiea gigantea TaxID=171969 RepID=A0A9Q1Q6L8_9CARY|nr:hypothetical protein Cgig2_028040 [Carnegiea gigantea]
MLFSCEQHVLGSMGNYGGTFFHEVRHQVHHTAASTVEDQSDPFSVVADELSLVADRLRSMAVAKVPKLSSAAEYFFKIGVEGKRFRPTVLLLMATALNMPVSMLSTSRLSPDRVVDTLATELRTRQQSLAAITEMIHVASILHDDVLDDAETRRSVSSLNSVMGNKDCSGIALCKA